MIPAYRFLHPRPACFLVTKHGERVNAMALAWSTPLDDEENLVGISVCKENYSHDLLKRSKRFVLCIASVKQAKELWIAGTRSGRSCDKLKLAKLELEAGVKLDIPHIKGCLGYLECEVVKELEAGEHTFFVGKVVHAWAGKDYFDQVWKEGAQVLLHLGSKYFTTFSKPFSVKA